ncbi:MAG: hypothetical protein JXJ17_07325 [Anaerolineae bacterium]|nr:hypothetical protein [Anaerolineae bacterium]
MTELISERDLITLNAYLDGELSTEERTAFECRLAQEPALRAELDATRVTVALMGMAERIRAPRNFTLDPARYGKPARVSFWDRLGIPTAIMAAVGAAAILLLCVGAFVFLSRGAPPGIGQVAMQEAAAPADMVEEATAAEPSAKDAEEEPAEEEMAEEAPEGEEAYEAAPPELETFDEFVEEEAPAEPAVEAEIPLTEEPAGEGAALEALPSEESEVQAEASAPEEEQVEAPAPAAPLPTSSPMGIGAGGVEGETDAGRDEDTANVVTASPSVSGTLAVETGVSTFAATETPAGGSQLPFMTIAVIVIGIGLLVVVVIAVFVILRVTRKR